MRGEAHRRGVGVGARCGGAFSSGSALRFKGVRMRIIGLAERGGGVEGVCMVSVEDMVLSGYGKRRRVCGGGMCVTPM